MLLDRSGSMASLRNDVIGGVNNFIEAQRKVPGEADFTLVQFDDKYEVNYENKKLNDVSKLTGDTFVPRGMTALLDAFGKTINNLGEKLSKLNESDRPERVIFVIYTDGQENSSIEFTYAKISEMVKHQREKYNWQFLFLGSNLDAFAEANKLGILRNHTMTYSASPIGTQDAYTASSNLVSTMRCASSTTMDSFAFSEEDIKKQEELLKNQP